MSNAPPNTSTRRLSTILARALRLRCAVCGQGKLFRGWFRMHPRCQVCGVSLERDPGYYLGSIYFNYGVTAVILVATYFSLFFSKTLDSRQLLWLLGPFCLLFPLWFFRYARSLWFALDHYFDPMDKVGKSRSSERR